MMEMKEQTGSRKKYLAPLVVLMLCLVALTGAAYAYSTSVISANNQADADYFTIDLYSTDTGTTIANGPISTDLCAATFTTALNKTTNKVTITANPVTAIVANAYVKVTEDVASVTQCKLTLTPSAAVAMTGILAGLTLTVTVDSVKVGGEIVEPVDGKYTINTNDAVATIALKATLTGTLTNAVKDIGTGDGKYESALAAAQAFADEFQAQAVYSLTASAEPVVTA